MRQISKQFKLNLKHLKMCREQMNMTLDDVQKKVKTIALIEVGKKYPTYRQLGILGDLYKVPRWVFISEHLPDDMNKIYDSFEDFENRPEYEKNYNGFSSAELLKDANLIDCTGCWNSKDCQECHACTRCVSLKYSAFCNDCSYSSNCSQCDNCHQCHFLANCKECIEVSYCENYEKIGNFQNIKNIKK